MSDSKEVNNLSPVKRALLEIKELQAKLDKAQNTNKEPIAIIGAGLRFPGSVNDLGSYWRLLSNGTDAITDIPKDRWDIEAFYDPDPEAPGKMYTRRGGFLSHIDQFDPHFFGISPREAISMDPQQRLVLQVAWEALENGGQAPDKLNGSQTGVFVGISNNDYGRHLFTEYEEIDLHYSTGNSYCVIAGRLSYILGLQGPSIAIDTACSSSLVAIHLACQSLRSGESNLALAGGVNLILSPEMNINFCKAKMMAFDDKCKTFDAAADGYVRGEGCAVIVLKRLTDALADQDNILGVIRGTAINQDGRSSGLTAPNGPSQEAVIRSALVNAGVEPTQVDYLEAHGTGTSLGDPIEVQALAAILGKGRSKDNPVMIGSVKTNFGHLEAAAGIAGLLKVVLSLQHQEIPPHLHLQELNTYIPWKKIPVTVPTKRTPWPKNETQRVGSVSSFGFSGTNAHIVLGEAPEPKKDWVTNNTPEVKRPFQILTLSAKRPEALKELATRFGTLLSEDNVDFNDFCFSANVGRAHLTHRLAIVSSSAEQARGKLEAFTSKEEAIGVLSGHASSNDDSGVTFLFTGHGSQYVNMGLQLYETHYSFRADLEKCSHLLEPYLEKPLLSVLYPSTDPLGASNSDLMNTMTYAQPAIFAIEYALAKLWISWGVEPTFVMGHSAGECAAACIAGVFSLADGLKLMATRGRLMDSLPQTGKMVTAFTDIARIVAAVHPYADRVSIAAVNGPKHVVISGASPDIDAIIVSLESDHVKMRKLDIAQAAHSPVMDPILDEFEEIVAEIEFSPPQIAIISTLTGKLVSTEEITDPNYWRRHMREPVQFAAGMESLKVEEQKIFVEIGPQPTLLGMGRRCLPDLDGVALWLPSLRKGQEDWQEILESVGSLYVNGFDINWTGLEKPYSGRHIPLPTYPWAKESYWKSPSKIPQLQPDHSRPPQIWECVVSAGRRQVEQAPLDLAIYTYQAKWNILDRLTTAYIVRTLRELNVFTEPNETHSLETILSQTKILDSYKSLLYRWLHNLQAKNLLKKENDQYKGAEPLSAMPLEPLWTEAKEVLTDITPIMDYVERCGEKLVQVLTGKENPLETLFPDGSYETVDYLYNNWPLIRYYYGILQVIVETILKNLPINKQLRILEIGAGTGGATTAILPFLTAERTQYQFTDISDFFLVRAQEKFKVYPFINYGILDIEKNPELQGYDAGSFDLIIAANSLHATRHLKETLAHTRTVLAPGGLLLLFEGTNYLPWFDITTSLIEGWGRFDDGLREDNPLLTPSQWENVLQTNGFEKIITLPEDSALAELLIHSVILAQLPSSSDDFGSTIQIAEHKQSQNKTSEADTEAEISNMELTAQLANALPDDRYELLLGYVREQVAKILRLAPSFPLERKDRLMDLGLDSLMAVELRSRLNKGLNPKRPLSATLAFDYPTIEAIAEYLETELFGVETDAEETDSTIQAETDSAKTQANIVDLSEDEVEALLLKKFDKDA